MCVCVHVHVYWCVGRESQKDIKRDESLVINFQPRPLGEMLIYVGLIVTNFLLIAISDYTVASNVANLLK